MAEGWDADGQRAAEPPPLRTWDDLVDAVDTLLAVLDMRLVADTRAAVNRTWRQLEVTDDELDQVFRSQTEDVARRTVEAAWPRPSRRRGVLPAAGVAGEGRSDVWHAHGDALDPEPPAASAAGSTAPRVSEPPAADAPSRVESPGPPDPALADPTLADPPLADPPLADPTLADPPRADPPRADPPRADPSPLDPPPIGIMSMGALQPPDAVPPAPPSTPARGMPPGTSESPTTDDGDGPTLATTWAALEDAPPLPRRTPGASSADES